jgi:hypothetical protein
MFEQIFMLGYWISLLLSTILGMIAIFIGIKIVHERPSIPQVFLVSLLVNLLTSLGILGILSALLPIPYAYYLVCILIWILAIKFFFPISWQHAAMIGIVGFGISIMFDLLGITSALNMVISRIMR